MRGGVAVLLGCFTTVRRLERLSFLQEIGKEGGQNEDTSICGITPCLLEIVCADGSISLSEYMRYKRTFASCWNSHVDFIKNLSHKVVISPPTGRIITIQKGCDNP